jgi:hypothetical protein
MYAGGPVILDTPRAGAALIAAASALVMLLATVALDQVAAAATTVATVRATTSSAAGGVTASAEYHDPNIVVEAAESEFLRSLEASSESSVDRGIRAV